MLCHVQSHDFTWAKRVIPFCSDNFCGPSGIVPGVSLNHGETRLVRSADFIFSIAKSRVFGKSSRSTWIRAFDYRFEGN